MTDAVPEPDEFHTARVALLAALIDGDVQIAQRLAQTLLADGYPFERIVENLFAPVQGEFGQRWAAGDLGVADEHAASEAVGELFTQLTSVAEPPTGERIVVATPEHDFHGLGARFIAAALTLEGFQTISLGAAVPPEDLGDYLEAQAPAALLLSCSVTPALASAAQSVAVAHEHGVPVVVGGRAIRGAERAGRLGADAFAKSASDAIAVLRTWEQSPPARLAVAPDPIAERATLRLAAPTLIAAAVAAAGPHAERPDRLADEMRRLLLVVESALLLGEPTLVSDHVVWLRSLDAVHGLGTHAIDIAVRTLADACDPDLARLGRVLRDSV